MKRSVAQAFGELACNQPSKLQRADPDMEINLPTCDGFDDARKDHRDAYNAIVDHLCTLLGEFGYDCEYSGRNDTFHVFDNGAVQHPSLVATSIKEYLWVEIHGLGKGTCVRVRHGAHYTLI